METVYIAVEKNKEVFELYKAMWKQKVINGIMVDSMAAAIELTSAIKNSKIQYLQFISISADDIDYMPELPLLSEVSYAPILIATSNYNDYEHLEAIKKGAFFYGGFCENHEQNIIAVETHVERYHQTKNKKVSKNMIAHRGVSISLSQRSVFFNSVEVELTGNEFNVLCYLFENRGSALSYEQIHDDVWKEKSSYSPNEAVKGTVKRIRKKMGIDNDDNNIIENIWGYGYKVPM